VRRLRFAALAALAATLTACGTSGLNFVQDERIEITAPRDRAKISLPATISWEVRDFEITGPDGASRPDAGYFGLYIDRAPQPPLKTQAWLTRDEQNCLGGCSSELALASRDIHSTESTEFTIDRLPRPSERVQRRREFHEVTIVLLDGRGRRIGESAFIRQFEVTR
jgi:predicted small lipoprotein YifL